MERERDIEAYLKRRVEAVGGLCWKWASPGRNGVPDRVVMLPGHPAMFVEVKRPSGQLSTDQVVVHRKMVRAGHQPLVVWSRKDVDQLMVDYPVEKTVDF